MTDALPRRPATRDAEDARVRVEQLRLLLGNVGSSVVPAILLSLLMVWSLGNRQNLGRLVAWCVLVVASKLYDAHDARRWLARGLGEDDAPRLVRRLILLNALDGFAWAMLGWAALGTTTVAGSILVIGVLAGIIGSSMALLSPVLPVFVAFTCSMLVVLGAKLVALGDPAYGALGVASLFYVSSLLGQARNSAIASRNAVLLRFENLALIEGLNEEKKLAQEATRKAEHANLAKSRFLAAASHDLRQPIHAQGLFLELLARSELDPRQREILGNARATLEATGEMLDTLLDFSRIEAGVVQPQVRSFALQPLLTRIEAELAPQADQKELVYRSRETDAVVLSDPQLVGLVLRNFVSNAIRYTEQGGVLVCCRRRGRAIVVEVWDTGIGIEPEHQRDVFGEFHQLGNPERDRNKGLGLGLAIADGLARLLQHPIALSSRPGRGSVFRLTLPLADAADPGDASEPARGEARSLRGVHVLLIDDDAAVRVGMLHLLQDWGCTCDTAENVEEAIEIARAREPDVIVSDYRLRERRTGAEAIAALRLALGRPLPALLITGDTAPERLREAVDTGVPLLHKPVAPVQLQKTLEGLVGRPDPP